MSKARIETVGLTRKQIEQALLRRGWKCDGDQWQRPRSSWPEFIDGGRRVLFVNAAIEERLDPTWALENGK